MMVNANSKTLAKCVVVFSLAWTYAAEGQDWPMWGGSPARNNFAMGKIPADWDPGRLDRETGKWEGSRNIKWAVRLGSQTHGSPEKNPPLDWDAGECDRKTGKRVGSRNVKWTARLGSQTIGVPVVADGLIWVGTNNAGQSGLDVKQDVSLLMCFRESDGKLLYQYASPRLIPTRGRDHHRASLGSSPLIEGDRIWFTTNRWETVCLDITPLKRGTGVPKIAWKVDMIEKLGVAPVAALMGPHRTCSVGVYTQQRVLTPLICLNCPNRRR